jgi:hexosaminidase
MPWPANFASSSGSLPISNEFTVTVAGAGAGDARVRTAVDRLFTGLARQTGIPILPHVVPAGQAATLTLVIEGRDAKTTQRLGDDERYSLSVSSSNVRISADKPLGALRGVETFLQLVEPNPASPGFSAPAVTIHDEPRFPWRGLSLDVSRHFIPVDGVKRTIDGLSAVKLNVLHLHLSDDQGFRIESKKYPRLQQAGSDSQFYTQAEIRDIISYAHDRGVRIVPEFDMPGHAASWLPGYPKLGTDNETYGIVRGSGIFAHLLDPTKESTYRFLDGFVGEMAKLFPDEYFHIGGDEVDPKEWNRSAHVRAFMAKHNLADAKALQTYFNQRLLKIVTKRGKRMEGWDEVFQPSLPKSIVIQSWRGQPSLWQSAREGFQGILSAGYYLDLMYPAWYHYSIDPMKTPVKPPKNGEDDEESPAAANAASPNLTPEQAKLILGGEAAMWEEIATAENLDAKLWPRLAAIAERFWSPEPVTDVHSMYRRLYVVNNWLQWTGLRQRTALVLMRQRLSGSAPYQPLDTFASVLEPVKGYSRHAEKYSILSPFNHLVDAIPPESDAAREFREQVDRYLASPNDTALRSTLRGELEQWSYAALAVRRMAERNGILQEDTTAIDALGKLSQTGLEALAISDTPPSKLADWKQNAEASITPYVNKRVGDLLIPIAPAIEKLVQATAVVSQ